MCVLDGKWEGRCAEGPPALGEWWPETAARLVSEMQLPAAVNAKPCKK